MNENIIEKIKENYIRMYKIKLDLWENGEKDDDILNGQIYALEWILEELDIDIDELWNEHEDKKEKIDIKEIFKYEDKFSASDEFEELWNVEFDDYMWNKEEDE